MTLQHTRQIERGPVVHAASAQETQRWLHEQSGRERQRQERSWPRWRGEVLLLFGPEYRGRLLAGSTLWFFTCLYGLAVIGFFPYYALHERGWSPERVGVTATLGFVVAFLGYLVSGPLLDFVGRKATACTYMTLGAVVASRGDYARMRSLERGTVRRSSPATRITEGRMTSAGR